MDAIPDIHLESVGRFVCGDHAVDESIVTGHVRGSFLGIDGGGAPVRFRMLHVFDIRDGLISREQLRGSRSPAGVSPARSVRANRPIASDYPSDAAVTDDGRSRARSSASGTVCSISGKSSRSSRRTLA